MRLLLSLFLALASLLPVWAQNSTGDCSGAPPAPLVVGERGQVSPGQSNNVRDVPSRQGVRVGQIPGSGLFEILDGPVCADGLVWWQIDYEGLVGWTVDGMDGEQWLLPVSSDQPIETAPPAVLSTTVITAENAARLQPNRTLQCETGADSSSMIALGSRYFALNCGFYNMNAPNASLSEQLLDDHLGIIDLETGAQVMTLSGAGADAYPIAFLPRERLLWFTQESINSSIILHLSDVTTGEEINAAEIEEQYGVGLFVHPVFYANGTRFALFYEDDGDYVLHRWDATTLTLLEEQVFDKPEALIGNRDFSFAIAPDGERFAVQYAVGTVSEIALYGIGSPQPEVIINAPFESQVQLVNLTYSPSGNFIVGAGCLVLDQLSCARSRILWWSAADGALVAEWDVPVNRTGRLLFSPDSALLAMGTSSATVLYDVDTGEAIHVLQSPSSQAVFSADGTFIVTNGDPTTTVWTVGE